MPNEIQQKYGSKITAQASAAITANTDSGGAQTDINNGSAGNGGGAESLQCYVNVTVAPSGGDAAAELYVAPSYNATMTDINYEYGLSVKIPNGATGKFPLGSLYDLSLYNRLKLKAVDYGFTASLEVVPVLPEAQ